MRPRFPISYYIDGILAQNRVIFSQTITLIESQLAQDQILSQEILEKLLPHTGKSIRIAITGVPGVGKSTFIEALGTYITENFGKKLAVLAIDPSSPLTKGSILGDKTRMERLAVNPLAYIRPSPSQESLGGVAKRTRETMLLCEAFGFEVIFVETVGVGQSEVLVSQMTDFFLLLMLAGAGDELQGIKKGIMEMADGVVITKANAQNLTQARHAQAHYRNALHLFAPQENGWVTEVRTCAALEGIGVAEVWQMIENFVIHTKKNHFFEKKRQNQHIQWFYNALHEKIFEEFYQRNNIKNILSDLELQVKMKNITPQQAVNQLFS